MRRRSASVRRTNVRVVLVGDRATGKSSLIIAAATERFPRDVPSILPPTRLPAEFYPDNVPMTIIDTSSSLEYRGKLAEELKRADVVILTHACDQPSTLNRLSTFWLGELRRLEIKVPVIVVGCKLDKRDDHRNLEQVMAPIMQKYREIETCMECSALTLVNVPEVFYYAQKSVLHPTAPLFDQETQTLKPRCVRALRRIFVLFDHDMDEVLNDQELIEFQVTCFNSPLQPSEIACVKRIVQEKLHEGVNDNGLTLAGFLFLHALFIEKGRLETAWAVLRKFGYNNDIKLRDDYLSIPFKKALDQSMELTSEAVEFLKGVFSTFDADRDGVLQSYELDSLFSTAPESPWDEAPYKDAVERIPARGLSLCSFLCEWSLMTLVDPIKSLEYLTYIGYNCNAVSAFHLTRRKSVDYKKQKTDRNVYQSFVFGPKKTGKSSLLEAFIGRPFGENYIPSNESRYAVNVVNRPGGDRKTLVLREIPEDEVKKLLSDKNALATCDVAVFVYDSSDEYSLKQASDLLFDVARRGEESGFGVPCLLIAAKDDIDSYPMAINDSTKVCQEFGIDAPVHVSVKERDLNNVYIRIVNAAERPHLNIPETEVGRKKKRSRHLFNQSLIWCCSYFCWISCISHLQCKEEQQQWLSLLICCRHHHHPPIHHMHDNININIGAAFFHALFCTANLFIVLFISIITC